MEHTSLDDLDHVPHPVEVNTVRKPVSDALGTTDFAVVYHELEPGDAFSGALHTHHDQEEVFYVLSGTATFEVGTERDRVEVGAGEAIRFAPGEFQRGINDSDERVVALAIGAPGATHDWTECDSYFRCRECGEETVHALEQVDAPSWHTRQVALEVTCEGCGESYSTADVV